ncbi:MAG: glycosyltransferase family 39 protein [Chloroflexota bacterium]
MAAIGFVAAWWLVERLQASAFYGTLIYTDTPVYRDLARAIVGGAMPYSGVAIDYPPVSLPMFLLPQVLGGGTEAGYNAVFDALMVGSGALIAFLVVVLTRLRVIPGAHRWAAFGLVVLSPLLIGPIILTRFDLWPGLLALLALAAALGRRTRIGAVLLALAIGAKVWPVVLVPLLLAFAWRQRGRREAVITAVVGVVALAIVIVPFLVAAPDGMLRTLSDQLIRPLQVESLGAALLFAGHALVSLPLSVSTSHGSQNLDGDGATWLAIASTVVMVVGLLYVWIRFARSAGDVARFVTASAAAVAVFVAFGKVLSPQYVIWLIPIVPLVPRRRGLIAMGFLAAAMLLTVGYFPAGYQGLVGDLAARGSFILLGRDLALVGLATTLALPWTAIGVRVRRWRTDEALHARLAGLVPGPGSLLLLLIVGSVLLRLLWLEKPSGSLIFDETYYVNAARVINGWSLPAGAPYQDAVPFLDPNSEHPPLGKAILAASMQLFGDSGIGWRLPSVLAGTAAILALYGIVRGLAAGVGATARQQLTAARMGLLAAFILSLDVLTFVHGRIGTLDMMALGMALVGMVAGVRRRWLLAGALLALACLVKLPSIYALGAAIAWAGIPLFQAYRADGRVSIRSARPVLSLVVTFGVVFLVGLWLLDLRYTTYTDPLAHLAHMLQYGFALADRYTPDSITSQPWQWLANIGQFDYLKVDVNSLVGGQVVGSHPSIEFRALLNPVLLGAAALTVPWGCWYAWQRRDAVAGWSLLWMGANFLPYLVLAAISSRVMYFYYVLLVVPGLAAISALFLVRSRLPRVVVATYVVLLVVAFVAYFPFRQVP